MQTNSEPMDTSNQFCPNVACCARGQIGEGNITIHDRQRHRYRCKICKQTFSARRGTMFEGLRKPMELIVIVVTRLSYGCPVQAIVQAFGLDDERWRVGESEPGTSASSFIRRSSSRRVWIWCISSWTRYV